MDTRSLTEITVRDFLDRLASSAPAPGGGAASALAGALAAALVAMVCNLTMGKKTFAQEEGRVRQVLARAEELRERLTRGVDDDAQAYGALAAAYRLPKEPAEAGARRAAEIQKATARAAQVPMEIAEDCGRVLDLCQQAVGITNPRVASDLEVAAHLALGALRGALANVAINLPSLEDKSLVAALHERMASAARNREDQVRTVVEAVRRVIAG